jgi:hypothetical protein
LKGENRQAPTHIFSVQHAASFAHDQGCANGLFLGATKNYGSEHNTIKEGHLHEDMKSYESENEAIVPFSKKPMDTKMVSCCTEKLCGRTNTALHDAHPLYRLSTASKRKTY